MILAVADKKSHKSAQMSAKKGVRETESPKKPVLKSILKSPFIPKWPVVSYSVREEIMSQLQKSLCDVGRVRIKKTVAKEKDGEPPTKKTKKSDTDLITSYDARKRGSLCVGLKETIRSLEKGRLVAGIVCLSTCPSELQTWLLGLVAVRRGISFVGLHDASPLLAKLLNVTTVLALGFKENAVEHFPELCHLLKDKVPSVDIPWLRAKHTQEPLSSDVIASVYDNQPLQVKTDKEEEAQSTGGKEDSVCKHPLSVSQSAEKKSPLLSPASLISAEERAEAASKRLSFSPIYQSASIMRTPTIPKASKKQKRKQKN